MKISECYGGKKVGRLTLLYEVRRPNKKNPHWSTSAWYCKCDCGRYRVLTTSTMGDMGHGRATLSCGCLHKEVWQKIQDDKWKQPGEFSDKGHKSPYSLLYKRWVNMHDRCENPKSRYYKDYGGRGIKVCDEWSDYEIYKKWALNNGYDYHIKNRRQSIDRIDVNGNYEPDNCRWTDYHTQANNRTTNVYITYNNETHTFADWGRITGIDSNLLVERYNKLGWRENKLFQPVRISNNAKIVDFKGGRTTFAEIANNCDIDISTIRRRYYEGDREEDLIRPLNAESSKQMEELYHAQNEV